MTTVTNGVNVQALLDAREVLKGAPEAAQFTWRASAKWQGGVHSTMKVQSFFGLGEEQGHNDEWVFEADHPEVFAAEDNGITPIEYLIVGLASCLSAGVASVAQNRGIQLHSVEATVEVTERSWMPRFSATDATPAVRQLARPTMRYSIGVMPLSVAAKTSGWSASNTDSCRWLCSSPRPKKLFTLIWLWTPFCHWADARQVNWAASGAPFSTSRASSSACTLTPLVTVVISLIPLSTSHILDGSARQYTSRHQPR